MSVDAEENNVSLWLF